jgi:hypothetical protein
MVYKMAIYNKAIFKKEGKNFPAAIIKIRCDIIGDLLPYYFEKNSTVIDGDVYFNLYAPQSEVSAESFEAYINALELSGGVVLDQITTENM